MDEFAQRYAHEFGRQLRALRRARGLILKQATERFDNAPSQPTLGSWENATRDVSLSRIVGACRAYGVLPHDLFALVDARVFAASDVPMVNLAALAETDRPELEPARRWAIEYRGTLPTDTTAAPMPEYALAPLAVLSGYSVADIAAVMPYQAPGGWPGGRA